MLYACAHSVNTRSFPSEVNASSFHSEVAKHGEIYEKFLRTKKNKKLAKEGKISLVNTRLVSLVPDREKTFYDYFILGNMLYIVDKEASYSFVEKAEALDPTNPFVLFERGMHEHRKGNCEKAANYYRKFHKTTLGKDHQISWAYLTHCNLRTGSYKEAIESWNKVNFSSHHTSIEKAMYSIFSESNPNITREEIINDIESGKKYRTCDLIYHDKNWEIDWWNHIAKEDYLSFDTEFAELILGNNPEEKKIFDFCSSNEKLSDTEYMKKLSELNIWGGKYILPKSSTVVYGIVHRLTSTNLVSPANILEVFESQLQEKLKNYPNETKLFDVLAYLYSATKNNGKLKDIDDYGWNRLHIAKYASSYLVGIGPTSMDYDYLLAKAISDFPNNTFINKLNMERNRNTEKEIDAIAMYVASEFSNVKNNWTGPYRLHDYMVSFAYEFNKINK